MTGGDGSDGFTRSNPAPLEFFLERLETNQLVLTGSDCEDVAARYLAREVNGPRRGGKNPLTHSCFEVEPSMSRPPG